MNSRVFVSRRRFLGRGGRDGGRWGGRLAPAGLRPAPAPTAARPSQRSSRPSRPPRQPRQPSRPSPPRPPTAPPRHRQACAEPTKPAATSAPAATAKPAARQVRLTFTARIGPQSEHFDAFGKLFMEKYPNITYVPQHIPTNEWPQKILVLAAGGTLPEVVYWYLSYFLIFRHRNLLQDISAQVKALNIDLKAYYPVAIDTVSADGKLYGIPWISHPGRAGGLLQQGHLRRGRREAAD